MIDFRKAEEGFKEYLKDYDLENGSIKLKIRHTYEVVKKSEYIATGLGLDKENIGLAKIIALLHDIGRFEQIKEFNEFSDKKMEHAEFGVKVLFEENLNDIESLHCKIIRDADKIDNFRVKQDDKFEDMFPKMYNKETINYEDISQKVYEDFMKQKCIKLEDRKTIIDYWVCVIAFIFDLNFDISLKYVQENNYIDILVDRIEYKNDDTKQKMEDIRKCAKEYIKNKHN